METLTMSGKEGKRLEVLSRVRRGEVKLSKAAELLSVSYRQVKRIRKRYSESRAAGLVHRLRGRPSNRRGAAADRERAVALYREKYSDFGPTLASEHLASDDGLSVPVTTRYGGGCGQRACGSHGGSVRRIAAGVRGRSSRESWCRWTDRHTIGSRGGVRGRR